MEVGPDGARKRFRALAVSAALVACGSVQHESALAPAAPPPSASQTPLALAARVSVAPPAPPNDGGAAATPSWPCKAQGAPEWGPSNAVGPNGQPFAGLFVAKVGHHEDAVRGITFVGPLHLASVGDDHALKIWDLCFANPPVTHHLTDFAEAVASFGGSAIAAADWRGRIIALDELAGAPRALAKGGPGVKTLAFSPDGQRLAVGGFSNSVRLLDLKTGRLLQEIAKGKDLVYSVAWSHDGKVLAVGNKVGAIQLFDVTQRLTRPLQQLSAGHRIVFSLAVTSDDAALVAGLGDEDGNLGNTVAIWNLHDGKLMRELHGHESYVYSVAVSRDGIVAGAGADGVIRLWNLATGEPLAVVHDPEERVNEVAFSADGLYLAAVSGPGKLHGVPGPDNTVRLYWLDPKSVTPSGSASH